MGAGCPGEISMRKVSRRRRPMADNAFAGKVIGIAGRQGKLEKALAGRFTEEGASVTHVPNGDGLDLRAYGAAVKNVSAKGDIDVWINLLSDLHTGPAESITLGDWNES